MCGYDVTWACSKFTEVWKCDISSANISGSKRPGSTHASRECFDWVPLKHIKGWFKPIFKKEEYVSVQLMTTTLESFHLAVKKLQTGPDTKEITDVKFALLRKHIAHVND